MNVSSESRARALLWLCHHYSEGTTPNPFDDPKSHKKTGLIPPLELLSAEEAVLENVDTPEEKEWGEKMTAQRKIFMENKDRLDNLDETLQDEETQKERGGKRGSRSRGRGVRRGKAQTSRLSMKTSSKVLGRQGSSPDSPNSPGRIYDADNAPEGEPALVDHHFPVNQSVPQSCLAQLIIDTRPNPIVSRPSSHPSPLPRLYRLQCMPTIIPLRVATNTATPVMIAR